jgi:hypothetical protein
MNFICTYASKRNGACYLSFIMMQITVWTGLKTVFMESREQMSNILLKKNQHTLLANGMKVVGEKWKMKPKNQVNMECL